MWAVRPARPPPPTRRPHPRGPLGLRSCAPCDADDPASSKYAAELLDTVERLDRQGPAGWVLDLRGNMDGNMWPMLAGLGPVLGEGEVGAFVGPDREPVRWSYRGGLAVLGKEVVFAAPAYRLTTPNPPVAVLTDEATASLEEAVVAFRGRPRTRNFGRPTGGLSTANESLRLSDGALLNLTVAVYADRTGREYGGPIEPEVAVKGRGSAVLRAAAAWLRGETGIGRARRCT